MSFVAWVDGIWRVANMMLVTRGGGVEGQDYDAGEMGRQIRRVRIMMMVARRGAG